jgi:hypothetical protein
MGDVQVRARRCVRRSPARGMPADGPFLFTGVLHTVAVDVSGDLITDRDREMRMSLARG